MVRENAGLPVDRRDDETLARTLVERVIRGEDVYLKGLHQISPALIFSAFSFMSFSVPTL